MATKVRGNRGGIFCTTKVRGEGTEDKEMILFFEHDVDEYDAMIFKIV